MLFDEGDTFETSEFPYPVTQRHRIANLYPQSKCSEIYRTGARSRFMQEHLKVNPK